MTIRHLKIFAKVCLTGSITQAGEALGMAQPAVSSAIKELENYYQVRLFDRMNRRLYLTPAGQFLSEHANSILTQLAEIKDMIQDTEQSVPIRIGSNSTFGSCYLPGLLQRFFALHPSIGVYTRIENSSRMEEALLRNELDFAIVDNLSASRYFHQQMLLTDQMLPVCSPSFFYLPAITRKADFFMDRSISLQTLASLPLLLRETGSGSRSIADKIFRMLSQKPFIVCESSSTQVLIELCLQGQGVMLLTCAQAAPYLKEKKLIRLHVKDFDLSRSYYLIYHKSKYLTKSMASFLKEIDRLLEPPSPKAMADRSKEDFSSAPSDSGFS